MAKRKISGIINATEHPMNLETPWNQKQPDGTYHAYAGDDIEAFLKKELSNRTPTEELVSGETKPPTSGTVFDAMVGTVTDVDVQDSEDGTQYVMTVKQKDNQGGESSKEVRFSKYTDDDKVVVNIDLTAEDLITRLKAGNIYKPEKIQTALNNFFKTENILQLRELALKEVAFRVERKVESEVTPLAPAQTRREKILACVSSNEHTPRHIIRKAYRLSTRYSTSFIALHVQTPKESPDRIKLSSQRYLLNYFQLVTELGGKVEQMSSPNVTDAIVQFCKENQVTTVCMGRPAFEMPEMFFKIGRYKRFLQQLSEMRIDLIIVA